MGLPALAIAAQLGGHAFEKWQSAKANKRYRDQLNRRMSEAKGLYLQEYYKDPLNTPGAKSALANVRENLKRSNKGYNQSAVRTGATAEQATAQKAQGRRELYGTINNLVQQGQQNKQRALNRWTQQKSALENQRARYLQGKRSQWNQFGQNIATTAGTVLDAYSKGVFSKGTGTGNNLNNPDEWPDPYPAYGSTYSNTG